MPSPNQLKALVDQHSAGPSAAALGMAPPSPDMPPEDDLDDEDTGENEAVDPTARGNELITGWGEFGTAIQESASELYEGATEIGGDLLLQEVPEDASDEVAKAVDRMPDELQMGLAKYVSGLDEADLTALATVLAAAAGEGSDVGLMTAFLRTAGAYAKEEVDVDEDFNESEEDEEETDEEAPDDAATDEEAPPAEGGGNPY